MEGASSENSITCPKSGGSETCEKEEKTPVPKGKVGDEPNGDASASPKVTEGSRVMSVHHPVEEDVDQESNGCDSKKPTQPFLMSDPEKVTESTRERIRLKQREDLEHSDTTDTGDIGDDDDGDGCSDSDDVSVTSESFINLDLHAGGWLPDDWEDLDIDSDSDREPGDGAENAPARPHYPQGPLTTTECFVCFEVTSLRRRLCCTFPVCDSCLLSYLVVQVSQATVHIECLNSNCQSYIHRDEILSRLPLHMKSKFYKFLIDANLDPSLKTCPRCSNALRVDRGMLKKRKVVKNGLYVTCPKCALEWCFTCHAPWHKGLTCKAFLKGDLLLKDWAHEFHYGQLNAQKCPKCKIYIQRSLGCDHMTCSRCETSFCYRCGEHYRSVKLLGNHFSRLSPFGCKYNFMPDAPHTRRLIRGAVLGGKLIGGLALSGFVVAAGAFLLGVSVVALPVWGGYKLHKRRRYRRQLKRQRKRTKASNYSHSLLFRPPDPPVLMPVRVLDPSDSTVDGDDSSDENRDHMRQLVIGLQLPDSQRVEVLVHRTVGSNNDPEEQGAAGGGKDGGGACEPSIILTDVQEVTNEDGYTTFVTHVYAKQLEEKSPQEHDVLSQALTDQGREQEQEYESDAACKEETKTGRKKRRCSREGELSAGVFRTPTSNAAHNDNNENSTAKKEEGRSEDKEDVKSSQKTFSVVLTKDCTLKTAEGEKNC